jgi:hypothetical protein
MCFRRQICEYSASFVGIFPSCKAVWLDCERFSELWKAARKLSPAAPECCYSNVGELLQLSRSVAPGLLEKVYRWLRKSRFPLLRLLCPWFMQIDSSVSPKRKRRFALPVAVAGRHDSEATKMQLLANLEEV